MEVVDNGIFSGGGGNANLYYYNGNQLLFAENVTNGYYYDVERNSLALGGIVKLQQEEIEVTSHRKR